LFAALNSREVFLELVERCAGLSHPFRLLFLAASAPFLEGTTWFFASTSMPPCLNPCPDLNLKVFFLPLFRYDVVLANANAYGKLVTPGSYMLVQDTRGGRRPPAAAVRAFLSGPHGGDFEVRLQHGPMEFEPWIVTALLLY
jgi:hypothetical protein